MAEGWNAEHQGILEAEAIRDPCTRRRWRMPHAARATRLDPSFAKQSPIGQGPQSLNVGLTRLGLQWIGSLCCNLGGRCITLVVRSHRP